MNSTDYTDALARVAKVGVSKADDAAVMAAFCEHDLQLLVGAVSGKLVWNGARKQGMTARDLSRLAGTNPRAVADLMWV